MFFSVDSLSLVRSYPNLRDEYLEELGFSRINGKFGGFTWFDNGMKGIYEPQLSFYKDWNKKFRSRVDLNVPKLFYGSNIFLPTSKEIEDSLPFTSNNFFHRTGLKFDAQTAQVCRIHYAINQTYEPEEAKPLYEYFENLRIPRLKRDYQEYDTIYFKNGSRGIRIYDKHRQIIDVYDDPELIEKSSKIFRFEYFINKLTPVKRFAKRLGFKDNTAAEMLSESNRMIVMNEFKNLLGLNKPNHSGENRIQEFFKKTGNINLAMKLLGFKEAQESFGDSQLRNNLMKRSTYYYLNDLCRKYGV